jgi:serine/threonine protein phosphatase 1
LGNHEEMILGAYQGGQSDHNFWCKFGGDKTLASYGVNHAKELPWDHLKFLADCADYLESDDFIFVHAGCDPNIPLEKNTGEILRWTKFPKEPAPHISGKTVVCGHTVQKQVLDLGHICCIDTGCGVWPGGRLTAIDLKSGKIWQAGPRSKKATIKQRG